MDRQERGLLLVEQEDVEREIQRLKSELQRIGQFLSTFGSTLSRSPESITFSNAPSPLGDMPMHLLHAPAIDWNTIPDKTTIAQMIQDLRAQMQRLNDIQRRLRT